MSAAVFQSDRPDAPRDARLARWVLAAALLIGLAARLFYLCEASRSPLFTQPVLDAGFHHAWAVAWSSGDWSDRFDQKVSSIPTQAYFRPPGTAFYLAALYRAFGTGGWAPRVFQAMLGLACLGAVYGIGRRIAPLAGACAALSLALYWPAVFYEAHLLDTAWTWTLSTLLVLTILKWGESRRFGWLALAGATLGLCAVFRPNILLFAPVAAAWVGWRVWASSRSLRRAALAVLCLTLATLLPILPVTLRNARVAREAVLISSNGGINFFIGNGPSATGVFSGNLGPLGTYNQTDDNVALARGLARLKGAPVTDREVGRLLFREALAHIRAQPLGWLRLLARKAGYFWGAPEVRLNTEPDGERAASRVLRALPFSFGFLAALGLAGFAVLRPSRQATPSAAADVRTLCLALVAVWTLSVLLFFVTGQYRQAIAPLLAVGAGVWLVSVGRALEDRRWPAAAVALGAALLAASLTCRTWNGYQPNRIFTLYNRAYALTLSGQTAEAEAAYRQLIEWPLKLQFRGDAPLSSSEKAVVAKAANALAVRVFRAEAWARAEELYALSLSYQQDAETLGNYGVCLLALGRTREAEAAFAQSLAGQPFAEHTRLYYAEALDRNGRRPQAMAELKRLAALDTPVGQRARGLLQRLQGKE